MQMMLSGSWAFAAIWSPYWTRPPAPSTGSATAAWTLSWGWPFGWSSSTTVRTSCCRGGGWFGTFLPPRSRVLPHLAHCRANLQTSTRNVDLFVYSISCQFWLSRILILKNVIETIFGLAFYFDLGLSVYLHWQVHCKKRLVIFPSPAGMSLTKLSLAGNNLFILGQGEFG